MLKNFELLLEEASELLNFDIFSDNPKYSTLLIDGLKIRIGFSEFDNKIKICAELGDISAGRYKIEILKCALIENNKNIKEREGTFAFSLENNNLVLFSILDIYSTKAEGLVNSLNVIIEKGSQWKKIIDNGELPFKDNSDKNSAFFGMKI